MYMYMYNDTICLIECIHIYMYIVHVLVYIHFVHPQFRPDVAIGRVELTPLAYAAQKGYYEITELLLTFQANVNYLCSVRTTILPLFLLVTLIFYIRALYLCTRAQLLQLHLQ